MFRKIVLLTILFLFVYTIVNAGEIWAPYKGYSSVNQDKAYNNFYFKKIEGVFSDIETYEHETQVYNTEFADYDGYWSSNLPRAYYDTPFEDEIDNFTIGSAQASEIVSNNRYYTYMALRKVNASDCTGCCSHHGGVCCTNGTTMCCDGTALSESCQTKCDRCKDFSIVRIKGQRGHRVPSWCYSTWCIFADETTNSMCILHAPEHKNWTY